MGATCDIIVTSVIIIQNTVSEALRLIRAAEVGQH